MQSILHTATHATILPQDDDFLYEVVDDKAVELGPTGAEDIEAAEPPQQTASQRRETTS